MLTRLLACLSPGAVFLDAGANLGIFSAFAAKVIGPTGHLIAFEPETVAFERLKANMQFNAFNNAKLFKLALSNCSTRKTLVLGERDAVSQSSHIVDDHQKLNGCSSEVIETVIYDEFSKRDGLPIPSVVKLDVEGHEMEALRGMSSTLSDNACQALFCELHPYMWPASVRQDDITAFVRSCGFDFLHIDKRSSQLHLIAVKRVETANRVLQDLGNSGESTRP